MKNRSIRESLVQTQSAKKIAHFKIPAADKKRQEPDNSTPNQKGNDLVKEVGKALDELLKPVESDEHIPYELTQEAHLRKLKKKGRRHKF